MPIASVFNSVSYTRRALRIGRCFACLQLLVFPSSGNLGICSVFLPSVGEHIVIFGISFAWPPSVEVQLGKEQIHSRILAAGSGQGNSVIELPWKHLLPSHVLRIGFHRHILCIYAQGMSAGGCGGSGRGETLNVTRPGACLFHVSLACIHACDVL